MCIGSGLELRHEVHGVIFTLVGGALAVVLMDAMMTVIGGWVIVVVVQEVPTRCSSLAQLSLRHKVLHWCHAVEFNHK